MNETPLKSTVRRWGQRFFRLVIQSVVHIHADGWERMARTGPLIVINNHINWLDAVLTYLFAPRHLVGFSKIENFDNPLLSPLMRIGGVIPVRRGTPDLAAVRQALAALEAGEALLVDPEGTRSHHGRLQEARGGVVLLALRTGAPIQPVAVWGQERFWRNLARLLRTRVWIRVGYPFHLRGPETRLRRRQREEILREVMYQLAALLPPPYRGVYADLESATTRYLEFPKGSRNNLTLQDGFTTETQRAQRDL